MQLSVRGRIEYYIQDLHASGCLYHRDYCSPLCRVIPFQFRHGTVPKSMKSGRPKDEDKEQTFIKMCQYLETNESYTTQLQ